MNYTANKTFISEGVGCGADKQAKDQRVNKSPVTHLITQRAVVQILSPATNLPSISSTLPTTYSNVDSDFGSRAHSTSRIEARPGSLAPRIVGTLRQFT